MSDRISQIDHLRTNAYADNRPLAGRVALYEFTKPKYDLHDEVIRRISPTGTESILDVGCADGKLEMKLVKRGHVGQIFGVDISAGIMKSTPDAMRATNVSFHVADVQNLPFRNDCFDVITACHMIYHVPDIDRAFLEILRVLKPNGKIIVSANSLSSKMDILVPLKQEVSRRFHLGPPPDTSYRFNIENGFSWMQGYFSGVELHEYTSFIEVDSVNPYIAYFESLRSLWDSNFSDNEWREVMDFVKATLSERLEKHSVIREKNMFGILIGRKND